MLRLKLFCLITVFLIGFSTASVYEVQNYDKSVVEVKEADESIMKGTGFVYGSEGYIITNNHILVENGVDQDLDIRFNHSSEWIETETLAGDSESDLAVLKPEDLPEGVEGIEISNSTVMEGEKLVIISKRLYSGLVVGGAEVVDLKEDITTIEGVVLNDSIVVDASVRPGDSGSPAVNSEGELVGVVTARDKYSDTAFLIPAYKIKNTLNDVKRTNKARIK